MRELLNEGMWVTPREYARLFRLSEQGLANQRSRERRTGRKAVDAPIWRKFGDAVRYFVPKELLCPHRQEEGRHEEGPRLA